MLEPYARDFGILQGVLVDLEYKYRDSDRAVILSFTEQIYIRSELNTIYPHCLTLNLESSIRRITRLLMSVDPSMQETVPTFPKPTAGEMATRLRELRETVDDELRSRLFLFVPAVKAALYDQEDLFGPAVNTSFGKATSDIKDSGSCLALNRPTAAVFHLMCVLEVGLDSLAYVLGLPYQQALWNTILVDIEKKVKAIGPSTHGASWKEDRDFYSQVALEFRFFKDAWRNHVAHARAKYNEAEATNIFDHVRVFMQYLATRLSGRP